MTMIPTTTKAAATTNSWLLWVIIGVVAVLVILCICLVLRRRLVK
jgi:nicotinamide riboside transporter PnuC